MDRKVMAPSDSIDSPGGEPPDQAQLALALGMSHVAFRQSLSRFRERFRVALRSQVADTLREPTDDAINDELCVLQSILEHASAERGQ